MNTYKKIIAILALLSIGSPLFIKAALPCGSSGAGVLNVGIVPGNLPWGTFDPSSPTTAVGFDPFLIEAAAQLLGYDTVNFIGFGDAALAQAALNAGTIDVFADSSITLSTTAPLAFNGVVTDVSGFYSLARVNGWETALGCCDLALNLELAVTELVQNGTYAKILQELRNNGQTGGAKLGVPYPTGVLVEPFPFAGSEVGSILSNCTPLGPISLPQTNCISAYLQANCTPTTTYTGATGPIIP